MLHKIGFLVFHFIDRVVTSLVDRFRPLIGDPELSVSQNAPVRFMSDAQLIAVNRCLPWQVATSDHRGRLVGNRRSTLKRSTVHQLYDKRIHKLSEFIELRERRITELGCLEGVHTSYLAALGGNVLGVDARPINLAKTSLRASLYGHTIRTLLCDLDEDSQLSEREIQNHLSCDILVHIGVLYHLARPIEHLENVLRLCHKAVLLDTHFSNTRREVAEFGVKDIYSGLSTKSLWLTIEDITQVLTRSGFSIRETDCRLERNGPRTTIYAFR